MTGQLALCLRHPPAFRRGDLLPNPAQAPALAWLDRTADWPLRRLILWGGAGTGKTHLLHLWAQAQGVPVLSAPPPGWPERPVALDGYDTVANQPLLHLLNAAQEARMPVLLAGRRPPGRLDTALPDLASRLRASTAVELGRAPDEMLAALLQQMLSARQLRVAPDLQAWLLARLPRSPGALRAAVETLEAGVQATGRTLSRPLAAHLLGLNDAPDPRPTPPV